MDISNFYERLLKKFPYFIAVFILRSLNWLFQGILFASRTEKIIKISLDLILMSIFTTILYNFTSLDIGIIVAFVVAHTFNWVLFTNIWSTRIKNSSSTDDKYCHNLMLFLTSIQKSLYKQNSIYGAAIYGSMSTGKFHKGSDVDIKLFRKSGYIHLVKSYIFLAIIRTNANIRKYPIDIYVIDHIDKYNLKKDEIPIILYDYNLILTGFYNNVNRFVGTI